MATRDGDAMDDPAAFDLLADPTRLRIVETLGDATADPANTDGIARLSYSDLKDGVGVRDSGRFNYHLTQLLGHFVRHDEEREAYALRWPGILVYQAVAAGSFVDREAIAPFDVGVDCHGCGAGLLARYGDGNRFFVECPACGNGYTEAHVPAAGLRGRSEADVLRAVHRHTRDEIRTMVHGQCPWCASEVVTHLHEGGDLPSDDERDLAAYATHHCSHCTGFHYLPVAEHLLYEPAVVAFYHERGHDLEAIPKWELAWAVTDHTTTVRDSDPWDVEVVVPCDGDRLVVRLDGSLDARVV